MAERIIDLTGGTPSRYTIRGVTQLATGAAPVPLTYREVRAAHRWYSALRAARRAVPAEAPIGTVDGVIVRWRRAFVWAVYTAQPDDGGRAFLQQFGFSRRKWRAWSALCRARDAKRTAVQEAKCAHTGP